MPVPLVPVMGVAVVGVAGYAAYRWMNRDQTVALIGRKQTGKTTLATFLETGGLAETKKTTRMAAALGVHRVAAMGDVRVGIRDTDGGVRHLLDWKQAMDESADVFYLFDAKRVLDRHPDTLSELHADADHLERWLDGGTDATVHLVGTHADLLEDIAADTQKVKTHLVIQRLREKSRSGEVILGSLASAEEAEHLTGRLLQRLGVEGVTS